MGQGLHLDRSGHNADAQRFGANQNVTHFGARPFLIEVLNRVSGGNFAVAWSRRVQTVYDTVPVNMLGLEDLKLNKKASGRAKDIADLENLPEA